MKTYPRNANLGKNMNDSSNDNCSQVDSRSKFNSNDLKVIDSNKAAIQTESKPNTLVEQGEVKNQSRLVYKFVANNFRFKKKFDVEP